MHLLPCRGTWENFEETRGEMGKIGVLEHKNGNISETRIKDTKAELSQR